MLSVVTIAFNDCDGLRRTLESVAEQDIDLEHVVVDGGSQDGTRKLLDSVDRPRFTYISEPDRGRYHAMNKGASIARGNVLWFMHAGDTFSSSASARLGYEELKRSEAGWGYGLTRVHRRGEVIEVRGAVPFKPSRFLVGEDTIPHQAVVMAADLLKSLGGYREDFGLAEDQRLLMSAVLREHPLVIPEILCDFDGDGAGSTRPVTDHFGDLWRARRLHRTYIKDNVVVDALFTAFYLVRTGTARAVDVLRTRS